MALPRQVELSIEYDGSTYKSSNNSAVSASGGGGTHTVVPGDTLWALAKKHYGNPQKHPVIYEANKAVIEAAAKAHGKASSENGHWIYPGTVLTIPGTETSTTNKAIVNQDSISNKLGKKIESVATSFSYTDVASGKSDSMSITLADIDGEWLKSLMPKRGANIGAKLKLINWDKEDTTETFDCGKFILDDISFSGGPLSCVLGGVSVPAMDDFKSLKKTKTWANTTIREIALEIANAAGVALCYEAGTVNIEEMEQNKQTDSAFLYSVVQKYGLAMKVYNHKIVIFDIVVYESKKAVLTIKESDMENWSYNTTVEGTYTGVTLNYTNPDSDETITVTMGSPGRMYELDSQASSQYDAELQAIAKLDEANRKIETMSVTLFPKSKILVASQCVNIEGLGKVDGKYYIDQIKHDVGSKHKCSLTLHKVQKSLRNIENEATNSGAGGNYTVVPGDTLWALAKKYYGDPQKHPIIYEANKETIEAAAKAHGKASSENGHWIYPGTVLAIPEV